MLLPFSCLQALSYFHLIKLLQRGHFGDSNYDVDNCAEMVAELGIRTPGKQSSQAPATWSSIVEQLPRQNLRLLLRSLRLESSRVSGTLLHLGYCRQISTRRTTQPFAVHGRCPGTCTESATRVRCLDAGSLAPAPWAAAERRTRESRRSWHSHISSVLKPSHVFEENERKSMFNGTRHERQRRLDTEKFFNLSTSKGRTIGGIKDHFH